MRATLTLPSLKPRGLGTQARKRAQKPRRWKAPATGQTPVLVSELFCVPEWAVVAVLFFMRVIYLFYLVFVIVVFPSLLVVAAAFV